MTEWESLKGAVLDEVEEISHAIGADVKSMRTQVAGVLDEFQPKIDEQIAMWATGSPWARPQIEALLGQMKARLAGISLDSIQAAKGRIIAAVRVALLVIFRIAAAGV